MSSYKDITKKCKKNTKDCEHCEEEGGEWKCSPKKDYTLSCFEDEWKSTPISEKSKNTPYKTNDMCYQNHEKLPLDKMPAPLVETTDSPIPKFYNRDYSNIKQGPNFKYDTNFNCSVRSTEIDDSNFIELPKQISQCKICDPSLNSVSCDDTNMKSGEIRDVCTKITDGLIMTNTPEVATVVTKVPCTHYGQSRIDLDRHRTDMMKDIYQQMDDRHCNSEWS